ncbi:MAG: B12-binding domain-containing radical SAM protein [Nanobdellota archaeon]
MDLLIYPPFAPPGIMPYSLANLKGKINVKAIDLNARFHKLKFNQELKELAKALPVYEKNNRKVLKGYKPEFFDQLLNIIKKEQPRSVSFSLVYNSQVFYTHKLIQHINVPVFLGGPAVYKNLKGTKINTKELNKYFQVENNSPDFTDFYQEDYPAPDITPVKSSEGCHYGACAFCTHHNRTPYKELPLNLKGKYFFFIDDMIPLNRLKEIALLMPKDAKWWAQLRPTKDLIQHLDMLAKHGLKSVAWGVESGSQRMLSLMRKGTNPGDMAQVLKASKKAGIINTVYLMSGFPGETREDFEKTIDFLKENEQFIDLVSPSHFGLQKETYVYNNPEKFGISIRHEKRTLLDDKLKFSPIQPNYCRKYKKTIGKINKLPKEYVYMKEQTLLI